MGYRVRLGALLLGAVTACSQHPGPAPAPGATTAPAAAAPAVAPPGAGPRIVMSPDFVHIEYRLYGHGEPAVLLVHGWACDADYWQGQIEPLAAHYTVVAMNLAGHGASGSNRSDWSIANYAQDVAAVARDIPNRQLVLVGHSMGGAVVLAATPLLGDRVIGIIAVEALRTVGLPPLKARDIEQRVAPFRADFIGATRHMVTTSLFPKDADHLLVQKVAYDMSLEPAAVAVPSMQALLAMDFAPLLPAIHVPVYAINSDLVPTDAARISKALPDFSLDVLGHSHFPMLEAPQRFNARLLQDLGAIAARAAH
ncbi:MAG TPA: alpha/beta hydrolase [Steroidobacteraceae bacterium]|jgi:pimeloyl-ACP methyl ester carboxylesterase